MKEALKLMHLCSVSDLRELHTATQATPVIAGIAVGAAAYAGKAAIEIFTKFRNAPPRMRQFYKVRNAVS